MLTHDHFVQQDAPNQWYGAYTIDTWEDFLLGRAERFRVVLEGSVAEFAVNQWLFSSYFQDDYRISPSPTLNLGVRHEFVTVPKEENGLTSALINYLDQNVKVGPM